MPFQPINFATIEPQGNPGIRDFVENLATGYKAGQLPFELQRQKQKEEIANAMSDLLFKEEPQRFKQQMSGESLGNALKQLQIQSAAMDVDPNKKVAYIKALMQGLQNLGGAGAGSAAPGAAPNGTDTSGAAGGAPGASPGYDISNQLVRKYLGLPAQTPEEQNANALKLFKAKQELKASEQPTVAFTTQNQKIIQAIDNTVPMIQELKEAEVPGQFISKYTHPNDQAAYEAKLGAITDSLVGALKLPSTNESLALVTKMVGMRPFESKAAYQKRLDNLVSDLMKRRQKSVNTLKGAGVSNAGAAPSGTSSGRVFNLQTGAFE